MGQLSTLQSALDSLPKLNFRGLVDGMRGDSRWLLLCMSISSVSGCAMNGDNIYPAVDIHLDEYSRFYEYQGINYNICAHASVAMLIGYCTGKNISIESVQSVMGTGWKNLTQINEYLMGQGMQTNVSNVSDLYKPGVVGILHIDKVLGRRIHMVFVVDEKGLLDGEPSLTVYDPLFEMPYYIKISDLFKRGVGSTFIEVIPTENVCNPNNRRESQPFITNKPPTEIL